MGGEIPFVQFLRPDGRTRAISIGRPSEVVAMAHALLDAGFRFEIEELADGTVHMDCTHPAEGEPVALEVCSNGPAVPAAVDSMVRRAHAAMKAEGRE